MTADLQFDYDPASGMYTYDTAAFYPLGNPTPLKGCSDKEPANRDRNMHVDGVSIKFAHFPPNCARELCQIAPLPLFGFAAIWHHRLGDHRGLNVKN